VRYYLVCCWLQGLSIDPFSAEKLKATSEELVEEKSLALECIGEAK
jgi:malate dehydrogenase